MAKRKITLSVILALVMAVCLYLLRAEHLAATSGLTSLNGMDLWEGSWISEKTKKMGDFQVKLLQEGQDIIGNIKIDGSPLTKGGDIKGTINGDKLEFGLVKDKRGELKYSGTISENAMSGTWQILRIKDQGTWQATKIETEPSGG